MFKNCITKYLVRCDFKRICFVNNELCVRVYKNNFFLNLNRMPLHKVNILYVKNKYICLYNINKLRLF